YVMLPYSQSTLAGLFRLARLVLVTPTRGGMNLAAHEYIAAQHPENPGDLIISRFAGSAEIFHEALIVNPFDADETAEAMRRAVIMPLEERKERWHNLMDTARAYSVDNWADSFLAALAGDAPPSGDTAGGEPGSEGLLPRSGTLSKGSALPLQQATTQRTHLPGWLRSILSGA